jgi:poly-beta-1,6-N-acetyl-D-glucosamine biosynthesis protein PgaD
MGVALESSMVCWADGAGREKAAHNLGQYGPGPPMSTLNRPWPPLIVAKHVPRLVKWRDTLLTLMLWGVFAVLLDFEFELVWRRYVQPGLSRFDPNTKWSLFAHRLMPFLLTASILAGFLIIFSVRTLRRRSRALLLPQPAPLEIADEAHRAGLDEAELSAARDQRIVIVHVDSNDRYRIEVPHGR